MEEEPIKTKQAKLSYKEKLLAKIKEFAVMDSVPVRVKRRMQELKNESTANNQRLGSGISAEWVTVPPNKVIQNLESSIRDGIGTISYRVMKLDKDGKKILNPTKMTNQLGNEIDFDGAYEIDHEVIETFRFGEKIKVIVR